MDIQQLEVYNYTYKNNKNALCIIAGAGSGKTTTIINKIIKMLNEDKCLPSEFLITTFTKNASKELQVRLKQKLNEYIVNQMTIGTFHSIANKYINKYNKSNNYVYNCAQSYDKLLYDYLILIQTDKYIESHKYIFIDEFQDIDEVQHNIIKILYKNASFLVVIGDDQQNIYTFRGSNIKYILNFVSEFNGSILKLETNYRCFSSIVKISNYLLSYNQNKIDKIFIPKKINKTKIYLRVIKKSYPYNQKIVKFIIKKIQLLIENNYNISDYAIISRYKNVLNNIECELAKLNIKSVFLETEEDNKIYENNKKLDYMKNRIILTTIHGTKGLEFKGVVFIDFNYIERDGSDIEEERRLYYVAITRAIYGLIIIINEIPSNFLNEIFTKSYENNDLFNNFKTEMILTNYNINNYKLNDDNDNDNDNKSIIFSVKKIINKLIWIQIISLDKLINFIENQYDIFTIHENITDILYNKYKSNQLITNFNFLLGIIIENYIQYMITFNMDQIFSYSLIDNIISNNIKQLDKNKLNYEKLLKNYYKINPETNINIYEYYINNNKYFKDLNILGKIDNLTQFNYSNPNDKSKYNKIFIEKCTNAYSNLINKKGNINDIIIYSINQSILDTKRFALQYIKLEEFIPLFKNIDITNNFIKFLHNIFEYTKLYIEKTLYYYFSLNTNIKIIGRCDILLETNDTFFIIDIKAIQAVKPDIKYLLQVLLYSCMYMLESKKKFTKIGIYSVIYGKLFIWNIKDISLDKAQTFVDTIIMTQL
jgi:hypothetical protein